jgi:uncharacterized membrane protein YoaK (UPF0700 family)
MLQGVLIQGGLLLLVCGSYFAASRRYPVLARPLSIAIFAFVIGVLAAVGGVVYRGDWAGVPHMLRRSAIGSAGWAVIIGAAAWLVQRLSARWRR